MTEPAGVTEPLCETTGTREGCRSLINIDLAPKEAACWRADPGHPRCGPIKSGSTVLPRRQGTTGSRVLPKERAHRREPTSCLVGHCKPIRPTVVRGRQITIQFSCFVRHSPAPGLRGQGTQDCGQPVSGRAINPPVQRPETEWCFHPHFRLPCASSEAQPPDL